MMLFNKDSYNGWKLGMAYRIKQDNSIVIPLEKPQKMTVCRSLFIGSSKIGYDTCLEVDRAPEHDLIPVSIADKLADAITFVISSPKNEDGTHWINGGMDNVDDILNNALTEYENYKGGK